ncbi:MAG: hypothetical protein AMXMBFR83_04230 [Phycisphaerae bacterium]
MTYFTCAWVCINMLCRLGCSLPVELWHRGPGEMSDQMRGLVEPLGVTCVDALKVRKRHPARILNGWELKPYAIMHSRFEEVLYLDADNVPVVDPTFLFETPQYREAGAIFWPDFGRLEPDREAWALTGVEYRDEPEVESGQLLIGKARCWAPLSLAMWMNEHSDFWHQYIHGDKETFHLAWRKLGLPNAMPDRGIDALEGVMCQHDFDGRRIFQHRNMRKFVAGVPNPQTPGFLFERECIDYLAQLEEQWTELSDYRNLHRRATPAEQAIARELCSRRWLYRRVGHDQRTMSFEVDGSVGEGADECERTWSLTARPSLTYLLIRGGNGPTCLLTPVSPDHWSGRWTVHERMPIELIADGRWATKSARS